MKADNEQLSALIDNEVVDEPLLNELISNEPQQVKFSRYQLIGDVMRGDIADQLIDFDISQRVMAEIKAQPAAETLISLDDSKKNVQPQEKNNVVSFVKRFGQYAIAASVAGIVVVASLVTSQPVVENSDSGIEVLNTVPFGGAVSPVSLDATYNQSEQAIKERNERLDALLKDHQLQLQMQP